MSQYKRSNSRVYDYGSGPGYYVYNELRDSEAYRVLTPAQKLIFLDMYSCFMRACNFNKSSITSSGFQYPSAMCREDVDESTFTCARTRICKVGFFRRAPHLESGRPAAPNCYLPSTNWREYKPTEIEQRRLQRRVNRRKKRHSRARERRTKFLQDLSNE